MKGRIKAGLAAMICLLLISGAAHVTQAAVSLGSVQDRSYAEMTQGGEVKFRLLFFNTHEPGNLHITLDSEHPPGLGVDVSPQNMVLPYMPPGQTSHTEGYEVLSTSGGNIMAKPVAVKVWSTRDTEPGKYEISVTASTKSPGGMMGVSQVRNFRFRVNVNEGAGPEEEEELLEEELVSQEEPAGPEEPEDRESPDSPGREEEDGRSTFTRQIEDTADAIKRVTGSIINSPAISPLVLLVVLLAGIYLKKSDRI